MFYTSLLFLQICVSEIISSVNSSPVRSNSQLSAFADDENDDGEDNNNDDDDDNDVGDGEQSEENECMMTLFVIY